MAEHDEDSSESFLFSNNDKSNYRESIHSSTPLPVPLTPVTRILMARQIENVYEANGSSILAPFSPVSVEKVNDLEQKLDSLKKDNSMLRAEVMLEQEEKFKLEKTNDENQNKLFTLRHSLNKYKEDISKLRAECDEKCNFENEVMELRQKNKDLQTRLDSISLKLNEAKEEITANKEENQVLEGQIRQFKAEQSRSECQIDSLQRNLEELQALFSQQSQDAATATEKLLAVTEEVKCLKDENDILREALKKTLCTKEHVAATTVSQIQGESMSVVTEFKVRELSHQVDDLKSTWTSPASSRTLQVQYKRLAEDFQKKEESLESLRQDRTQLNKDLLEEKIKTANTQKELENAERRIIKLERQAKQSFHVKKKNSELTEKLKNNVEERIKINDKLSMLQKLNESLESQKSEVMGKQEKSLQELAVKEKKIQFLLEQLESHKSELSEVALEIASFNSKLDVAESTLAGLQDENNTLKARKEELEEKLLKLADELKEQKSAKKQVELELQTRRNQINGLEKEREGLVAQIAKANKEITNLQNENENLLLKLEASELNGKEVRQILSIVQSEQESLREDINTKTLKLANMDAEAKKSAETLAQLQSALDAQRDEFDKELLKTKEDWKQGNDVKETLETKLKTHHNDTESLKVQYSALESTLASRQLEAEDLLQKKDELAAHVKRLETNLQAQQTEITSLKYERDDAVLKLEATSLHHSKEKAAFQAQCSTLNENVNELTEQNKSNIAISTSLKADLDRLKSDFARVLTELMQQTCNGTSSVKGSSITLDENLQQDFADLTEAISNLKQSSNTLLSKNNTMQETVTRNNESASELRNKIDILQSAADAELKIRSANLSEIADLKEMNSGVSSQLKLANEKASDLEREIIQLKAIQVESEVAKSNTASGQIETLSAEIRLKAERNDFQAKLQDTENALLVLKEKYGQLEAEANGFMSDLTLKQEECEQMKTQLQSERHEMSEMKGDVEALQSQLDFSANQLKTKSDEIERLTTENEAFAKSNSVSQVKLVETEQKCLTLKEDLDKLVKDLASKTEENKQLSAKHKQLQLQFTALEAKVSETGEKHNKLLNEQERFESEHKSIKLELSRKNEEVEKMKQEIQSERKEKTQLKTNTVVLQDRLAFCRVMEEPDDPNYDRTSSLHRVAELQKRNSKQLSHLKSSYPIETQGRTPSKCDEAIRLGDSTRTLRRISELHESSHAPPLDNDQRSIIRALPGYRSSSHLDPESQLHGIKRSHFPTSTKDVRLSSKENTVKKGTMFDISFTPPAFKRNKTNKGKQTSSNVTTRSRSKAPNETENEPPPSARHNSSAKKTPSLMNRMRRPLGKLNLKK